MAALLPRKGLSAEGVYDVLMRVLTEEGFRAAAGKVSKRIRSRKRTPLQEAAGELPSTLLISPLISPYTDPSRKSIFTALLPFAHPGAGYTYCKRPLAIRVLHALMGAMQSFELGRATVDSVVMCAVKL